MLADILTEHLNGKVSKCLFGKWLKEQDEQVQDLFAQLVKKDKLNIASLWRDLISTTELPFKSTTFKSHMRGECSCPKH
jgi:hypothetical protein